MDGGSARQSLQRRRGGCRTRVAVQRAAGDHKRRERFAWLVAGLFVFLSVFLKFLLGRIDKIFFHVSRIALH